MKIEIESNILRYYLRDVYFITGTAYAGKSTMARLLAEQYGLVHCGENYHDAFPQDRLSPELQPNLCYFQTMRDWQEFIHRSPEDYARWIDGSAREAAQIEIAELIQRSARGRGVVADTNIPLHMLHLLSDEQHVAVMLSPQSLSVERFFDRDDEDKQFLLRQIEEAPDPEAAMRNFKECVALINSRQRYDEYLHSGFYTIVRGDPDTDTRQEVLAQLAAHFGLTAPGPGAAC